MAVSAAGRPQETVFSGPGYRLAEWLNQNWDKVGETNFELASEWGYKSPAIISMWRTGKSRVPIERLNDLARKMNVDMAFMLPLWIDQFSPDREKGIKVGKEIAAVFKRLATTNEFAILNSLRKAAAHRGQSDPVFTARQLQAIEQIAASDDFANMVLDEAKKQDMIEEIADLDED